MAKLGREDVAALVVLVLAVLAFAWVFWLLVLKDDAAASVSTAPDFDHSQCQYPARATNPPDGCDNSDPACPAEIKGGSCEKVDVAPVFGPKTAPAASEKQITSKCAE